MIGEYAFHHRRHQAKPVVRRLARLRVGRRQRLILGERDPDEKRPRRLVEGADFEQHAPHIGMDEEDVGGLVRLRRALQRAALPPILGIRRRVLIGDFGQRQALNRDAEARAVHHHEHRRKTAVLLADEPAFGAIVIEHCGRVAVDAHLVLDRAADDAVALAGLALGVRQEFRHEEQRDALDPRRRALDAGEHEMDDVVGEVVLAGGDEDLLAGDGVGAVGLWDRAWS